jgi:ubiquinone/menaquinone biosynthesis C-methylase UbiE
VTQPTLDSLKCPTSATTYYQDKIGALRDIFGVADLELVEGALVVGKQRYPIVNDVIVLLDPVQYPSSVRALLGGNAKTAAATADFAEDIQHHYGKFWSEWSRVLPYQEREFSEYFDLVDLSTLNGKRVADFGCGMGRWSWMLARGCKPKELVLIDFSDAIFTARRLMAQSTNALFFMGDLTRLPFRDDFADFIMSLGVLHHLPVDCLQVVRNLKRFAPRLLIYLYYALDNKPFYNRWLLRCYTPFRKILCRVRSQPIRVAFSWAGLGLLYLPFIAIGYVLKPIGLSKYVPLFEEHHWAGLEGMRHSVYDRFFTRIEQRVSRAQIRSLEDTYSRVILAEGQAYYHFLCER